MTMGEMGVCFMQPAISFWRKVGGQQSLIVNKSHEATEPVSLRCVTCLFYGNIKITQDTLDFRLGVQNCNENSHMHAQKFLFNIPAQSARMHGFSAQFLGNQPEIECIEH